MLWNNQQSTNYMGKFWRGTYVAQLCISGQKQLNTDWRLCQVSQISKKQHFTRFTTQPWPFQALERGDLLIIVSPNHHCHHRYHHRCHHVPTSVILSPCLLTHHIWPMLSPLQGACWKKKKVIWSFFILKVRMLETKKVNLIFLGLIKWACWKKKVNLENWLDCLGARAVRTWNWISSPGNLNNWI